MRDLGSLASDSQVHDFAWVDGDMRSLGTLGVPTAGPPLPTISARSWVTLPRYPESCVRCFGMSEERYATSAHSAGPTLRPETSTRAEISSESLTRLLAISMR